jgi:hypothetical protein
VDGKWLVIALGWTAVYCALLASTFLISRWWFPPMVPAFVFMWRAWTTFWRRQRLAEARRAAQRAG